MIEVITLLNPHRLDDQNFVDIVSRSRRLIQKYAADWTNENASDPGITILEMLAWLKDNMQYYMDQSHLISRQAYMELLGIRPIAAKPAFMIARAEFVDDDEVVFDTLPAGFPVWADDTRFELEKPLKIQRASIQSVYASDEEFKGAIQDLINAFDNNATAYPFGKTPEAGKTLYIGLDDLTHGTVTFYLDLQAEPENFRNTCDFNDIQFAKGQWEIAVTDTEYVVWEELTVIQDESHNFMESGIVHLEVPERLSISTFNLLKGHEANVWIRYRLLESEYDRAPVLKGITLNAVKIVQKHSVIKCHHLIEHTDDHHTVSIEEYVPEGADALLEMKVNGVYKKIDDSNYTVERFVNGIMNLELGAEYESVDLANLRFVTADPTWGGIRHYDVKGLPYEEIETIYKNAFIESMRIEISDDYYKDKWAPWNVVQSLWSSSSDDPHILFDASSGHIHFGNNEMGMLPDPKENGLRIIQVDVSGMDKGNGTYNTLLIDEIMGETFKFEAITKAVGGYSLETEEEAFNRFKRDLNQLSRMMSRSDIEDIIKHTPGLAIRDVSVIAGEHAYDNGRIIVLPKSNLNISHLSELQLPDIYKRSIDERIAQTRLVTENWKVSGPDYIGIKVKLEIIKDPAVDVSKEHIRELVSRFIEPDEGHLFGRRFSAGILKRRIESIGGVINVTRVSIRTVMGSYMKADGDVQLPQSAIGYLNDLDIQILDDQGW